MDYKNEALKHWNNLLGFLRDQEVEVPTNPIQKNRIPKWFRVSMVDGKLLISNAKSNKPTCSISSPRSITCDEFIRVYPFYLKRKAGFSVSMKLQLLL